MQQHETCTDRGYQPEKAVGEVASIEIRIKKQANGRRVAYYRTAGSQSRYWHFLPVRQAEKAIKSGRVDIGIHRDLRAIAAA